MSQLAQLHHEEQSTSRNNFLVRFRKNLIKEISQVVQTIGGIIVVINISFIAIMLFIFEFGLFTEILSIVVPPVAIFLIGKYLTLLPMYIVTPLALASILFSYQRVAPIIGIAAFFSLFKVFLF